jgi:hypothetical protein
MAQVIEHLPSNHEALSSNPKKMREREREREIETERKEEEEGRSFRVCIFKLSHLYFKHLFLSFNYLKFAVA